MNLDALLDEIADRVAARLRPALERSATAVAPLVYTTNKAGPHVPGKTRSWMRDHVKAIPGGRKVGRDWVISAVDYDAWVAAKDAERVRNAVVKKAPVRPVNDTEYAGDDEQFDAAQRVARSLQHQGLRRSR